MKNAIRLKLFNPGCKVTVLYKNIVTYGFREEYYTEARRLGVIFIRYTDDAPAGYLRPDWTTACECGCATCPLTAGWSCQPTWSR